MTAQQTRTNKTFSNAINASHIFEEYGDFIYRVIKSYVGKKIDVEDLFHDFFLKLVEKPIPDNIVNMKGYLYRAVTRDALDYIRREKAYNARIGRYAERYERCAKKGSMVDDLIKTDQAEKILEIAKNELPDHFCHAVNLRFRHGYTNPEIGERMNVDSKSVGRYISISLKKIRKTVNCSAQP